MDLLFGFDLVGYCLGFVVLLVGGFVWFGCYLNLWWFDFCLVEFSWLFCFSLVVCW